MRSNRELAALFEEMAELLDIEGGNPFRVRAYQRAAQVIAELTRPASELSVDELLELPGIGKGTSEALRQAGATGSFKELEELRGRVPAGLRELLKLPGLGPKRAKLLYDRLKIDSLDSLRKAARAGALKDLKGFGPKLEAAVLESAQAAASSPAARRMLHWHAKDLIETLIAALRGVGGVERLEPAGSFRRGRETVGDIDLLCTARQPAAVIEAFTKLRQVERVTGAGGTKASAWLTDGIQCDLRVVAPESYGAALVYFTGSKAHNIILRGLAQEQGLTVNEYGVYKVSDKEQKRSLAGRTEEEVYRLLGMDWIPPELREDKGEIDAARRKALPRLVELSDIRGDFHNHSSHTDGAATLEDMARAAKAMGWEWVALGDHSRSLRVARGLSIDQLRQTFKELDGVRAKVKGIQLMRSMEVDILSDGALDYPDKVLEEIDVVIGSVHSAFDQDERTMTERIVRAVSNPHCDILGHLSGRLLNRREGYRVDAEAVFKAAAQGGTAVELNGQPDRQDIYDVQAMRAKELKVPLVVDTDAHSVNQFQYMEQALVQARRAWLTKDDLLNCLSYKDLRAWLSS